ncbi:hydroxymethylpyrimidine ABC transporter substrate-binding protein [Kocuria sp. WN036]|uniref:CE1759 family FMN reductase n=1 Tax=Kocuria sp. WN036 TaxID=2032628 RepID=UPI000BABABAA|nr:CE1759 family FMN reductase [Kocuria sp. WN036]PAU92445.1 hydroxymethylpyrimidine ABC transporter substrate-binding protein [Kocuria sp. WN036]
MSSRNITTTTTPDPAAARPLTVAVVSAGMSDASSTSLLADRLAEAARDGLAGTPVRIERVDLRPLAHAVADHLLTGFPGPELRTALDTVAGADALIAATPTYKASYSGLFKSFFDLVDDAALEDVPVLVAATGGTARHSLMLDTAMRPLFTHLKALVLSLGVYAATEDWAGGSLESRIRRASAQLARSIAPGAQAAGEVPAGAAGSERGGGFEGVPDFADLLARAGR